MISRQTLSERSISKVIESLDRCLDIQCLPQLKPTMSNAGMGVRTLGADPPVNMTPETSRATSSLKPARSPSSSKRDKQSEVMDWEIPSPD